jgi:serine phosphatase RsbU (regulator of sigma subunit)/CheY-like chemotaxis protein
MESVCSQQDIFFMPERSERDSGIQFKKDKNGDADKTGVPLTWKILVVDDEVDVHKVTRLVLSDFKFAGRIVELISAFTGEQAKDILRVSRDIAIVLLDVVMEEYDTGLKLVEFIRNELNNNYVRIILRTGQPGQAPEREVIVQYDINDYKSKTELTSEKLITSVVSCLRAFGDIVTIDRNRRGLERIIISSEDIFNVRSFESFMSVSLEQIEAIIQSESSHFVEIGSLFAVEKDNGFVIKAVRGNRFKDGIEATLDRVLSQNAYECVQLAISQKMNVYRDVFFCGFLRSSNGVESLIFVEKNEPFDEWEKDLLDIFLANILIALENINLNNDLEQKVRDRTKQLSDAKHELETANEKMAEMICLLEQAKHIAETDMRMAINVQENILPKGVPESCQWDVAYCFRPMSGISGDFYDFYINESGEMTGLSLFDVSGHGIASGLITMLAKSITYRRFKSMEDKNVGEILDAINDDLIAELDNVPNFLSGVMFRFQNDIVQYSNAGHPDAIMKESGGDAYSLSDKADDHKGFYLGLKTMLLPHPCGQMRIKSGDMMMVFSDGLIEATSPDNETYGSDRLKRILSDFPSGMSSKTMLDAVIDDFNSFIGKKPVDDDVTMIIVKRR